MIQPKESNNVTVSHLHHHRSRKNSHKHLSTKKRQPSQIIHVNVGTLGNICSISAKNRFDGQISAAASNDQRQRSIHSVAVTKLYRYHHSNSQNNRSIQNTNDGANSKTESSLLRSPTVTPSKTTVTDYNKRNKNDWPNEKGMTNDYHQTLKNKKKSNVRRCIIASVLIAVLIGLIIAAILLALFIKPKSTSSTQVTPTNIPVLRWNTTGITVAGNGSSGNANNQLSSPFDVILDYEYNFYIADYNNHRIQKYSFGSSVGLTVAGNGTPGASQNELNNPTRSILDPNGNLYIADSSNNRTQFWTVGASSGSTVAGSAYSTGSLSNQLQTPYGLALNPSTNELYILDNGNQRIMSYALGTNNGTLVFGGNGSGLSNEQLWYPRGLHFDSFTNTLTIANANANNIVQYVLGASSSTVVAGSINGTAGTNSTLFNNPNEVTFDPMGNMYVADRQNQRIQFFYANQPTGITIAGILNVTGNTATTLNKPRSVRLDNQLNLYVADTSNNRIQKFLRY